MERRHRATRERAQHLVMASRTHDPKKEPEIAKPLTEQDVSIIQAYNLGEAGSGGGIQSAVPS